MDPIAEQRELSQHPSFVKADDAVGLPDRLRMASTACVRKATSGLESALEFIVSTEDRDRYNSIVTGWTFKNYIKNPVMTWAHDYSLPPIGRSARIGMDKMKRVVSETVFTSPEVNEMGYKIQRMYEAGFMNAVSAGFIPRDQRWVWEDEKKGKGVWMLKGNDLLEHAAVPVPANPQALALACKRGVLGADDQRWFVANRLHDVERGTLCGIPVPDVIKRAQDWLAKQPEVRVVEGEWDYGNHRCDACGSDNPDAHDYECPHARIARNGTGKLNPEQSREAHEGVGDDNADDAQGDAKVVFNANADDAWTTDAILKLCDACGYDDVVDPSEIQEAVESLAFAYARAHDAVLGIAQQAGVEASLDDKETAQRASAHYVLQIESLQDEVARARTRAVASGIANGDAVLTVAREAAIRLRSVSEFLATVCEAATEGEERAGAVLNAANKKRLTQIRELAQEVLDTAGDDEAKSEKAATIVRDADAGNDDDAEGDDLAAAASVLDDALRGLRAYSARKIGNEPPNPPAGAQDQRTVEQGRSTAVGELSDAIGRLSQRRKKAK